MPRWSVSFRSACLHTQVAPSAVSHTSQKDRDPQRKQCSEARLFESLGWLLVGCGKRASGSDVLHDFRRQLRGSRGAVPGNDLSGANYSPGAVVDHLVLPIESQERPGDIDVDVSTLAIIRDADTPLAHLGTRVERILQYVAFQVDRMRFHEDRAARAQDVAGVGRAWTLDFDGAASRRRGPQSRSREHGRGGELVHDSRGECRARIKFISCLDGSRGQRHGTGLQRESVSPIESQERTIDGDSHVSGFAIVAETQTELSEERMLAEVILQALAADVDGLRVDRYRADLHLVSAWQFWRGCCGQIARGRAWPGGAASLGSSRQLEPRSGGEWRAA